MTNSNDSEYSQTRKAAMDALKQAAEVFETAINAFCTGREKSLAITNLEQSLMWANRAISVNEDTPPVISYRANDSIN